MIFSLITNYRRQIGLRRASFLNGNEFSEMMANKSLEPTDETGGSVQPLGLFG
jgi:hypothetical protein